MLKICHVYFEYHEKNLLQDIDFHLPAGGLLHLRGANGAGKTTLLRLIAGLFEPDSGEILLNGLNQKEDGYQQQLCLVSHKLGLSPYLSIRENAIFDLQTVFKTDLEQLLQHFALDKIADIACANLSAGQQRRAALLRLTLSKAKLWLLDEPLIALDDASIMRLVESIITHRQAGGAVILTSHQGLPVQLADYQEYWL